MPPTCGVTFGTRWPFRRTSITDGDWFGDQLAVFRPNFVQNCEFRFFVQNAKFRDFVRFSSKTNFLCPYSLGDRNVCLACKKSPIATTAKNSLVMQLNLEQFGKRKQNSKIVAVVHTRMLGFYLTTMYSHIPRLGQLWLQTRCSSCHPTNGMKVLNDIVD